MSSFISSAKIRHPQPPSSAADQSGYEAGGLSPIRSKICKLSQLQPVADKFQLKQQNIAKEKANTIQTFRPRTHPHNSERLAPPIIASSCLIHAHASQYIWRVAIAAQL